MERKLTLYSLSSQNHCRFRSSGLKSGENSGEARNPVDETNAENSISDQLESEGSGPGLLRHHIPGYWPVGEVKNLRGEEDEAETSGENRAVTASEYRPEEGPHSKSRR